MIDLKKEPAPAELRWFAVYLVVGCALVGALIHWRTGSITAPAVVSGTGTGLALAGLLYLPLLRAVYFTLLYVTFPIGWTVTHLILAGVFFLLVTPIGLLLRFFGKDPLERTFDGSAESYWVPEEEAGDDVERYFKGF